MTPRLPISAFQNPPIDTDVEKAFNWFKNYISEANWLKRKSNIETYLSTVIRTGEPFSEPISNGTLLVIQKDQIGWYLYLVYTYLFEYHKYEYYQGSRVIPIFKRIGIDIDLVPKIEGVTKKMKDMFRKRPSEADAILFEILTALLWVRNGWQVRIIEEEKTGKTPDLEVRKGDEKFQVECKRQMKTSDYAYKETKKRQLLLSAVSKLLLEFNVLLDIKFHVELFTLPDNYLYDLLHKIIPTINRPGKIISNEIVEIDLAFVDIATINDFTHKYFIKNHSPNLLELIAKKEVDNTAFTSGILGSTYYVGEGEANNLYVYDIVNAYGVHCYCDAENSINAKARDVKNQILSAISQFSQEFDSIIHIGMETFDGPHVERKRNEKILNSMAGINTDNNKLNWIFYHYFQSYTRSHTDWFFDETVSKATSLIKPILPIKNIFLIIPEGEIYSEDMSHWDRKLP